MYTKIQGVSCGKYSDIRAKEPSGSLAVLGEKLILNHADGGDSGALIGLPVGVGGVDLGDACHFEAALLGSRQGGDHAGEGAADGELGDAVLPESLGNGVDVLVPNDLREVDEVVPGVLAAAVGPEGGGVDALGADVLDLVGNSVFKCCNLLHGIFLRFYVIFPFGVHIFALNPHNSKSI